MLSQWHISILFEEFQNQPECSSLPEEQHHSGQKCSKIGVALNVLPGAEGQTAKHLEQRQNIQREGQQSCSDFNINIKVRAGGALLIIITR